MILSRRAVLQAGTIGLGLAALPAMPALAGSGTRGPMAGGMVIPPMPYAMHDGIIRLRLGDQDAAG